MDTGSDSCIAGPKTNIFRIVRFVLTNADTFVKISFVVERVSQPAAVAQSVERRIGSAEVTGPIPVSSLVLTAGTLNNQGSRSFCVSENL